MSLFYLMNPECDEFTNVLKFIENRKEQNQIIITLIISAVKRLRFSFLRSKFKLEKKF
jgi:hypothetical protein